MGDTLLHIPGYDLEAELGRGGMGVVYRVRRHEDGRVLALKMILGGRRASFAELARFRIEAEALACLNHPNIVKVREVGLHAGYPYFAMDFAARGSLKQALSGGPGSPAWAAELVRTLALAMQHAHDRGMLHRDLKPANVLLTEEGAPIITDFGLVKFAQPVREVSEMYCTRSVSLLDAELARFARELRGVCGADEDAPDASEDEVTRDLWERCATRTGLLANGQGLEAVGEFLSVAKHQHDETGPDLDALTRTGAVMGSPSYMAPEQAAGDLASIGPCTDIYALGGILYESLTGRPPFPGGRLFDLLYQVRSTPPVPVRRLVPAVSGDIEAVCLKCLEKSPTARYQSGSALAEDLGRCLDGRSPLGLQPPSAGGVTSAFSATEQATTTVARSGGGGRGGAGTMRGWWPFRRGRS